MNLTVKVAAGVFIGSVAAYVVVHIPSWYRENKELAYQQRVKNLQYEMSKLTPEMLISKCGKPVKDETRWTDKEHVGSIRLMTYKENIKGSRPFVFGFNKYYPDMPNDFIWLTSAEDWLGTWYAEGHLTMGRVLTGLDCLDREIK